MTDEQIKAALSDWVKDYCNNLFLVLNPNYDGTDPTSEEYITLSPLPGGVLLFLNQAADYVKTQTGVKSESLGDYSVTFETDFPMSMLKFLKPYKRVKFV